MTAMAEKKVTTAGKTLRRSTHRVSVELQIKREAALAQLEKALAKAAGEQAAGLHSSNSSVSHRARVQAARARYALATHTDMERVSAGAWVRKRYL